jgi:XTP/dITP diphosphohydrolase
LIAAGRWFGAIAAAPRGTGGFGYDPIFVVPDTGQTAAELSAATKHRLSHRGQALHRLVTDWPGAGAAGLDNPSAT